MLELMKKEKLIEKVKELQEEKKGLMEDHKNHQKAMQEMEKKLKEKNQSLAKYKGETYTEEQEKHGKQTEENIDYSGELDGIADISDDGERERRTTAIAAKASEEASGSRIEIKYLKEKIADRDGKIKRLEDSIPMLVKENL